MNDREQNGDGRRSGGGGGGGGRGGKFSRFGKTPTNAKPEEPLDYKSVAYLSRFLTPTGKIQSRRRTGFSGQNQRKLTRAIKNARLLALLPYIGRS